MKSRYAVLAVLAGVLLVFTVRAPASAQEPGTPDELCKSPDVGRAVKLALGDDRLIIAVASAAGPADTDAGTPIRIEQVVKGKFPSLTAIADRQPTLACHARGAWGNGSVIGVFLISGDELVTLAAWPFPGGKASVAGASLSVDEFMARGRAFVEPSPTALPPGVPPPPAKPDVADTGFDTAPPVGMLPVARDGAGSFSRVDLLGWSVLGLGLLAGLGLGVRFLRRR